MQVFNTIEIVIFILYLVLNIGALSLLKYRFSQKEKKRQKEIQQFFDKHKIK